ncbi:MAG: DUF4886 domain-containing protein [Clostridia bacterium]|nr:DUF4886 domain-containing protein [Clostridia bacterium]
MKILSIGNSFSMDAQKWLYAIAASDGVTDIETVNLYRGGCNLRRHCENILGNVADYMYQHNGDNTDRMITIDEILSEEEWDYITVQQVSHLSGLPQHYVPYINMLVDHVREKQPKATIVFHQTWAYEKDSPADSFGLYNRDQKEMHRRIVDCAEMACILTEAEYLPCGEFIQHLRDRVKEFDYPNGGISLCHDDGFHLSKNYGRYAAGAFWYHYFTGRFHENTIEFAKNNRDGDYTFDSAVLDSIVGAMRLFSEERKNWEYVMDLPTFADNYRGGKKVSEIF